MIKDKYEFCGVFSQPASSAMSFGEVEDILNENDVLIQCSQKFKDFNLFHKTKQSLLLLDHKMPTDLVLQIALILVEDRGKAFNYWYNQFDPQLKDFNEIKYLFEQNDKVQD